MKLCELVNGKSVLLGTLDAIIFTVWMITEKGGYAYVVQKV